ncbi:hypothetical protein KKD03_00920 [Patescibacteria group bacterium]|nr:hypothetical protein [Patescibacteria group bacterium]
MKNILKHKLFILLFILAILLRYLYIKDNVVPFMFDHGKDALAILDMVVTLKPKFIGPWTSIPGLYFGPAWYYLLSPFFLLSGFNPASGAVAMSILVLIQMFLVYKYFNIESATIVGFSGFWLMISKSAWNPFPMTLLTILIMILIIKQLELKKLNNNLIFGLAIVSSFGFHFSSAFAIFYPIIIGLILLLKKFKISIKNLFVGAIAFTIPFIPQILFEFKNNFPEFKAIINYFSKGEGDAFNIKKIVNVLSIILGEFRTMFFESLQNWSNISNYVFIFFIIFSLIYIFKKNLFDKKLKNLVLVSIIFIIIPIIGFFFLHFNVWYVYPIIPVITVLIGSLIHKLPKLFSSLFIILFVLFAAFRLNYYIQIEKPLFLHDSSFYPVKKEVIKYIREISKDKPFSVYVFQPDIYDFPYQYEFLVQGLNGAELPVEFAYEPNITTYVMEKENLMKEIDSRYGRQWKGTPKIVYYVVNGENNSELLTNWWGRQRYGEIINEKKFGDSVTVYTATPLINL